MTDNAHARRFPDLPPVWLALHMLGVVLVDRIMDAQAGDVMRVAGTGLLVAGFALVLWSGVAFRTARTSIHPGHRPDALITGGPFRINRNPIYTGFAAILAGFAVASGAWPALVLVPIYIVVITRRFVLGEEDLMRAAFGDEARDWIANSRRW